MPLTEQQRLILSVPPIVVLSAIALLWFGILILLGYLDWFLPVLDRPIPSLHEPVLTPGMRMLIHAPSGDITITAGKGRKRTYEWDNGSRSTELTPNRQRWSGAFGVGRDGRWFPHRGISHYNIDEGQLNFCSIEQVEEYLSRTPASVPFVYRNDGLTAWISKQRDHLGVKVFQIYINGVKPLELRGAQDERILLSQGEQTVEVTKAPVGDPNEEYKPNELWTQFRDKGSSYE